MQQGVLIIAPASAQPVVLRETRRPHVVVNRPGRPRVLIHGVQGPKGSKGDPGDSSAASGRAVVAFAFGDASPLPVFTPAADCTGILVRLLIDTPFDGVGAAIRIGTAAQPDALMGSGDNDPATVGGYEVAPDLELISGTPIVVSITPGAGASKGAGRIVFDSIA